MYDEELADALEESGSDPEYAALPEQHRVERLVGDIDEIVRMVWFPRWHDTKASESVVQKALRKVIYVNYQITDQHLFDRAFGYIRKNY